ncbi:ATP-binding protein [Leptolyngbya sp. AN02str]|uniref:ATP-binding protein n=1 Tax=Leptolyngbya sp. AN02str TaxID=3423363 RepID=UPI003D322406
MGFQKATKEGVHLRLALMGPSGAGKTYTALRVGGFLAEGGKIALIDTEQRSSCRYSHLFDFDVAHIAEPFHPNKYIGEIREAAESGYKALIIDSLSHAWFWALSTVGSFNDWGKVRPLERALLNQILAFPGHVIVTMRSQTEWAQSEGTNKKGHTTLVPQKVGTKPIQSNGIDYEFDVVGNMDTDHIVRIDKTRLHSLDGKIYALAGEEFAEDLLVALREGGEANPPPNRTLLSNRVGQLVTKLGWETEEAQRFLINQYEKSGRGQLSVHELQDCIVQLEKLVAAQAVPAHAEG